MGLYGEDENGNTVGKGIPAGTYEVTIKAYSEADLGGDWLQYMSSIKFRAVLISVTGATTVKYAENSTSDVATYEVTGFDAGSTTTWSLSGDDSDDFSISSAGVLTFSSSPNYESPTDANTDNEYKVTINASDGTNTGTLDVTVTVTNVNEAPAGAPTISGTAQVGQTLTADTSGISDPDGLSNNVYYTYQWLAGDTEIGSATRSTYTVQSSDNGKVIKVRVTFTDNGRNTETLTSVGTSAVILGGL